jgi:NO-binding membrane sensor protein with MHYT domain
MNALRMPNPESYKLSFIINTVVGGVMLLLAIVAQVFETIFPALRGQLVWGFVPATLMCWFIASLHYSKYLSLTRSALGPTSQ